MNAIGAWLKWLAPVLLTGLLVMGTLTAQAVMEGEAQMRLSDRAFDAGEARQAAQFARRAATHYAPGAPHVRAAYDRLLAVAAGAEAAADYDVALFAWRAVRGAALESRHVRLVYEAELEQANRALLRLQLGQMVPEGAQQATVERKLFEQALHQDTAIRTGWILLLLFGFTSAAIGLAWFIKRGMSDNGRIQLAAARVAVVLLLVGTVCWTWAVASA
jgi:hypothetical protein